VRVRAAGWTLCGQHGVREEYTHRAARTPLSAAGSKAVVTTAIRLELHRVTAPQPFYVTAYL